MSKPQRIVLSVYCLLIVYCCLWIPWYVVQDGHRLRVSYAWIWAAPAPLVPDLPIVGLRLLAATALAGIGFAATWK